MIGGSCEVSTGLARSIRDFLLRCFTCFIERNDVSHLVARQQKTLDKWFYIMSIRKSAAYACIADATSQKRSKSESDPCDIITQQTAVEMLTTFRKSQSSLL